MAFTVMVLMTLAMTQSAPQPQSPSASTEVFSCLHDDAQGKDLWLTTEGENLVYHYGFRAREELTIVGRPASGIVHYRGRDMVEKDGRFTDAQVRFSRGPYSYIVVWTIRAPRPTPVEAHFVIAKGHDTLSVRTCESFHVDPTYPFSRLPTDDDAWEHDQF